MIRTTIRIRLQGSMDDCTCSSDTVQYYCTSTGACGCTVYKQPALDSWIKYSNSSILTSISCSLIPYCTAIPEPPYCTVLRAAPSCRSEIIQIGANQNWFPPYSISTLSSKRYLLDRSISCGSIVHKPHSIPGEFTHSAARL